MRATPRVSDDYGFPAHSPRCLVGRLELNMPGTKRFQTLSASNPSVRLALVLACLMIVAGPAPSATASFRRGAQMYREQLKKEAAAQEKLAKEQAKIQQEMIEKAAAEKNARDAKRQENLRRNREAAEKRSKEKAAALRKRIEDLKAKSAATPSDAQSTPLQMASGVKPSTVGGIRAAVSAAVNTGTDAAKLLDSTATIGAATAAASGG